MTDKNDIEIIKSAERFDSGERMAIDTVDVGHWFWIKETATWNDPAKGRKAGDEYEWFGCVAEVGSNYVELQSPPSPGRGYSHTRIHFNEFEDRLRFEPDPNSVIDAKTHYYQTQANNLIGEISQLTNRLGVAPTSQTSEKLQEGTNSLIAVSSSVDVTAYKSQLIEAKEKTLPALFKEMEAAHSELGRWMGAKAMAVRVAFGSHKTALKLVDDRLHTIELYAGLTEEAVLIRDGEPASRDEKLRVMQRRFYMDEECLAAYEAGGMEMRNLSDFDEWLSKPDNYKRILPFERCLIAFRVRRMEKERNVTAPFDAFINILLRAEDKETFLYARNGEQLWRVNCNFNFGEKLVPDVTEFDPSQPMMVKLFGTSVKKIIPKSQWEAMREAWEKEQEERKAKKESDPNYRDFNMYSSYSEWNEYEPFDPSSVYYDDAVAEVSAQIKKYNRVAVIIQGLYDRSMVLQPHKKVQVYNPESFEENIELVYDATTLTHGDKPDFDAYRARLNASLTVESVVVGQEDFWLRQEAEKENTRQQRDHRTRHTTHYTRFKPHNNDGPGLVTTMNEFKPRAGKAVFKWERNRRRKNWYDNGSVPVSLTVPVSELLNVSAYTPGDFKRFFDDPRTRQEYLKWAPLMLAAEDYHAGKPSKSTTRNVWE